MGGPGPALVFPRLVTESTHFKEKQQHFGTENLQELLRPNLWELLGPGVAALVPGSLGTEDSCPLASDMGHQ